MNSAQDIAAGFAELELACACLRAIEALDPARGELRRPELSGWSALEHVAHVALANELIVRNLHSLISGGGPLVQAAGEPAQGALNVLESGVIPRGQAQSPRMVRPPTRIDRALLVDWLATSEQGFGHFSGQIEIVARAPGRVPHQLLGPLTAAQWVRFASIHTRHHLAIAEQVLAD